MKYDAVVFDFDGTITDSAPGIIHCIKYALNKLKKVIPPDDVLCKFLGPPMADSFIRFCGLTKEEAMEAVKTYRTRYKAFGLKELHVYPGIRDLLYSLRKTDAYLAIATGKQQEPTDLIVDRCNLRKYFDHVVGPTVNEHHTEKSDIIQRALNGFRGNTVVIGDRASDIEAAHELGLDSIAVMYGYGSREELSAAKPTFTAESAEALFPLLGIKRIEKNFGYFISFEGNDGCGKSTQSALLYEYLHACGYEVIKTREPGGSEVAEKIRDLLLDRKNIGMQDMTEALLLAAARAQHVRDVIKPALNEGKIVMTDRYIDSSVAYQGEGRKLGMDVVSRMNDPAIDGCLPDLTLMLKINWGTALRRRECAGETDRIEMMSDSFHARVEKGFQKLAELYPERIVQIDARGDIDKISHDIIAIVNERLSKAGIP